MSLRELWAQPDIRKGGIIGLAIGILWSIPLLLGIAICGWNFLEWKSSLPLCNNEIIQTIFFLPFAYIQIAITFLTLPLISIIPHSKFPYPLFIFIYIVLPVIILLFLFLLFGILIACLTTGYKPRS